MMTFWNLKLSIIFIDQYHNEMKNHMELTVSMFVPHKTFDMMCYYVHDQLRGLSIQLVDSILNVLF
jgi:hypothetical protein